MPSIAPVPVRHVYLAPTTAGARPIRHKVRLRPARCCAACPGAAIHPWPARDLPKPNRYAQAYLLALDLGAVLGDFLGVDLIGIGRLLRYL